LIYHSHTVCERAFQARTFRPAAVACITVPEIFRFIATEPDKRPGFLDTLSPRGVRFQSIQAMTVAQINVKIIRMSVLACLISYC